VVGDGSDSRGGSPKGADTKRSTQVITDIGVAGAVALLGADGSLLAVESVSGSGHRASQQSLPILPVGARIKRTKKCDLATCQQGNRNAILIEEPVTS
jgi:hypothetical protein